jgi:hypothetical protein
MVNLMKFKSPEHAQRFLSESRARTGEFIRALGATIMFAGLAGPEFCAGDDWDLVLVVQYPDFSSVHQTLTDESIGPFVSELRADTIERSRFLLTTPLPVE